MLFLADRARSVSAGRSREVAMLEALGTDDWIVIATVIAVVGFWVGWIADQILDEHAFGLVPNVALVMGGAFAGLWSLDWLFLHYYVAARHSNAYVWFSSCLAAGTGLLLVTCLARAVLRRA